jgi:hypothetical protein
MAEQHNHINFSLTDIDRYLQGRMSATEMHELEKAALQDPFLADAIEGYTDASAAVSQQHLEQISVALLQEPKEDAKVVPLSGSAYGKWIKIAAAVIILAGTGTLGWRFIQSRQEVSTSVAHQITNTDHPVQVVVPPPAPVDSIKPAMPAIKDQAARSKQPATIANDEKPTLRLAEGATADIVADSTTVTAMRSIPSNLKEYGQQQVPISKQLEEKVAGLAVSPPQSIRIRGLATTSQWKQENKRDSVAAPVADKVVVAGFGAQKKTVLATKREYSQEGGMYILQGKVTDDKGSPVANATVKPLNGYAVTSTDLKGAFQLKSKDTAATVTVSSVGYDQAQARISTKSPARIQLDESDQSLAEVVVTEMYSRKKNTFSPTAKDTAYPAGGWQSFQEYVAKKLHKDVDTTGGDQRFTGGEIELEFMVAKDGNPHDVKIIRSFDNTINNKAIDALKNGPRWIANGKKKKARVIVRY